MPETIRLGGSHTASPTSSTSPTPSTSPSPLAPLGGMRLDGSIIKRAMEDDTEAMFTMFRQFISLDEQIRLTHYLGIEGFWGFGTKSFACATDRRVAAIRVGPFGEVIYQDGFLEYVNCGVIYQPSKLYLFLFVGLAIVVSLFSVAPAIYVFLSAVLGVNLMALAIILTILLGSFTTVLSAWVAVKLFYRLFKCGLVWWVREGVYVYAFANRGKMLRANQFYRHIMSNREARVHVFMP